MARLHDTPFEGTLAASGFTYLDGTSPAVSTVAPLSGAQSLRVAPPGSGGGRVYRALTGSDNANAQFFRFDFSFGSLPTAEAEWFTIHNTAFNAYWFLTLDTTGHVHTRCLLQDVQTSAAALSPNTKYRCEVQIQANQAPPNDRCEVIIYVGDSMTIAAQPAVAFWDSTATGFDRPMLGGYAAGSTPMPTGWDFRYDNFAANDSTGTFNNSWLGPAIWASGAGVSAASGNVTASYPADVALNDILVAEVTALDNVTCTFPAGWTKKAENNNGTGLRQTIAWKRYDPTWLILDDFERSAGAIGSNWTTPWDGDSGTMAVATGGVAKPGAGTVAVALWAPTVFAADQQAYVVLGSIPDTASVAQLFLRGTPSTYSPDGSGLTTCFILRFAQGTGAFSFRKKIAGASSVSLGTFTQAFSAGDAIGFRAVGTTLTAWRKVPGGAMTQIGSVTDSSVTGTGQIGFSLVDPNTADAFGGGAVADTETSAVVAHTAGGKILARVHRARGRITTGDPFETSGVSTPAAAATGTFPTVTSLTNNAAMLYALSYAEDYTVGSSITNAQSLNLTQLGEDEIA